MLVSSVAVAAPMAERSARTKITQDRVLLGPRLLLNAGIAAAATEAQSVAKVVVGVYAPARHQGSAPQFPGEPGGEFNGTVWVRVD